MEPLGDIGHVESRLSPIGDCVSVGARHIHGLRQTYHRLRNHFGCTRWYSYVTRLKWMFVSVHLEIGLILTQDRCIVCTKCTKGSKIVLYAPDRTPRRQGSSGISFLVCLEKMLILTHEGVQFAAHVP
jgi:hypothetical protein